MPRRSLRLSPPEAARLSAGDAAAAALLAAAAARASANLVAINLAAGAENELVARAREVAEDAADSARFVLDS